MFLEEERHHPSAHWHCATPPCDAVRGGMICCSTFHVALCRLIRVAYALAENEQDSAELHKLLEAAGPVQTCIFVGSYGMRTCHVQGPFLSEEADLACEQMLVYGEGSLAILSTEQEIKQRAARRRKRRCGVHACVYCDC